MSRLNWTRHPHEASRRALKRARGWRPRSFGFFESNLGRLAQVIVLAVIGVVFWRLIASWDWLSTDFWDWLRAESGGMESGSSTLRNLGLVIAGACALLLAIWRSWVAQRQADTGQQHLLNERYQQGAEMLGSEVLSVRLGGIYALARLAAEHPDQYHLQVTELLCAFVRHPTMAGRRARQPNLLGKPGLREDLQAILTTIGARHGRQLELEKGASFRLDLRSARLAGAWLEGACLASANLHDADLANSTLLAADLSGARLVRTDLSDVDLTKSDLTCASLVGAKLPGACLNDAILVKACLNNATLSRATLAGSDLSGTTLFRAKLSRAELSPETRLTQNQLNQARADPDNPPFLDGIVDAESGEALVWRGKTLDDQA